MNTIQVALLFACMYAMLVIVAELIYMMLDDFFSWRKYRKREEQYEKEWLELIFERACR